MRPAVLCCDRDPEGRGNLRNYRARDFSIAYQELLLLPCRPDFVGLAARAGLASLR